ncbi:hypothetical protein FRC10_011967 [Ceratobasidium sp. 414]|nr:hypothetical protein FRC10_011967 [Ceratobasidium sp. 414]
MAASKPRGVHFVACVHGMWGVPAHLSSLEDTIQKAFPEGKEEPELVTLRIRTNADSFTYDGLDWGAERAVKEIYEKIGEIEKDGSKKVTRFSIVGYSLGGLISRYAIGILYQRGFFKTVKPVNFTTFATPHIGLPRFRGFIGRTMYTLGPVMLSRTGRQFYCVDNDTWSPDAKEGRPLLEVMSDKGTFMVGWPSGISMLTFLWEDSVFFKALSSFPHMTIYGNAVHDLTVTYCTAMIEPHDPFTHLSSKTNRLAIKLDPEYRHVIQAIFKVPEGEEVPAHDLEKERRAERDAIPWYSPARYRSDRPFVPPFLQFPFPLNILFYLMVPVLIPLGLTYAAIRFRRESRESRKRLAELAASPDAESSLSTVLRRMEMAVANAVDPDDPGVIARPNDAGWESASDMEEGAVGGGQEDVRRRKASRADTPEAERQVELERGAGSLPSPLATPNLGAPSTDPLASTGDKSEPHNYPLLELRTSPDTSDPSQPMLTPGQLKMIDSLNSIPQLQKVRAYFPFVRNAHSVIVARDPGLFPIHETGLAVLKHWADRFVL